MKTLVIAATAAALLSGIASAAPAMAAPYQHRHAQVSTHERAAIARSRANLNVVKRIARADGRVSLWERAKIRMAEARHKSLVQRLRHN